MSQGPAMLALTAKMQRKGFEWVPEHTVPGVNGRPFLVRGYWRRKKSKKTKITPGDTSWVTKGIETVPFRHESETGKKNVKKAMKRERSHGGKNFHLGKQGKHLAAIAWSASEWDE